MAEITRITAAGMTPTALDELIEIQADLAELRKLACVFPPETEKVLQLFADLMERRAREIDKMI
ncbi:hypothetical protein ACVI1J_003718 [Bradyrhizobium diazoefficiens]|uniref:hypothetical protein n=1 Tax=Bradyrhizobium liaoningense TaxID=43992 RepID=UPI000484CEB7|nr:hypothetical protein [Bradyrhizobium liaoningense]MCP1774682.1 hypothetical protein [Bradyrhizobium japonicum]